MKVLLVEDSRAILTYLTRLVEGEPDVELLKPATDGLAAVAAVERCGPDVVLLDLELPGLHGIDVIRTVMASRPCPIVVLSSFLEAPDRDLTFESLEAGAVEVMAKPAGLGSSTVEAFRRRLLRTLRLMSQAHVVRRRPAPRAAGATPATSGLPVGEPPALVAIGASTGGPGVLSEILRGVRAPLPFPVAVSQHIVPGFEPGLARWLQETGHRVEIAEEGARVVPGVVHLSLADRHLILESGRVRYVAGEKRSPVPSADLLFESALESFGTRAAGVLLTGMGEDGAAGLLRMRRGGALTLAQRADTCVIDGMPGTARRLGAAAFDVTPGELAGWLASFCGEPAETRAPAAAATAAGGPAAPRVGSLR